MIELYNNVSSLLGRAFYLGRSPASRAMRADIEAKQAEVYAKAEDLLASALQKQGLAAEVAHDGAFRFVSGILEGLAREDALHESASA